MKKFLPFISIAFLMAACNSVPPVVSPAGFAGMQQANPTQQPDTTGIAEYQQWKSRNELGVIRQDQTREANVSTRKPAHKSRVYQTTGTAKRTNQPAANADTKSANDIAKGNSGSANSDSAGEAKAQKKGISKAAKGAVIGGVAGAAGGAVLSKKNRVLGAVIGGVVGAAGGYGIGRKMDRKDGRIEYDLLQTEK